MTTKRLDDSLRLLMLLFYGLMPNLLLHTMHVNAVQKERRQVAKFGIIIGMPKARRQYRDDLVNVIQYNGYIIYNYTLN